MVRLPQALRRVLRARAGSLAIGFLPVVQPLPGGVPVPVAGDERAPVDSALFAAVSFLPVCPSVCALLISWSCCVLYSLSSV